MTTTTTAVNIEYTLPQGFGNSLIYAYDFQLIDEDDVGAVFIIDSNSESVTFINGIHFLVTINNSNTGGNATFTAAGKALLDAATGVDPAGVLTIARKTPVTQLIDWVNNGLLDLDVLEESLDKLTLILQEFSGNTVPLNYISLMQQVLAMQALLLSVEGNQANINSAVANEANINSAVGNEANINSAVANESNIISVAGNESNITQVSGNSVNINGVAGNETNINIVAAADPDISIAANNLAIYTGVYDNIANILSIIANLPAIQVVAPTLTMTNVALTLNLGPSEIVGSTYTTLQGALDYADTVLQKGGELTITVPAGTYSCGSTLITGGRVVTLNGVAGSIIQFTGSGNIFRVANGSTLNVNSVDLQQLSSGAGIITLLTAIDSNITFYNSDLSNVDGPCLLGNSNSYIKSYGTDFVSASTDFTIKALGWTKLDLDVGTVTNSTGSTMLISDNSSANLNAMTIDKSSGDHITCTNSSDVLALTVTHVPATIQYSPAPDVYGNGHSLITTTY